MHRSVKRPMLTDADRLLWIMLASVFPRWRECLLIVKPETVMRWHRKGWQAYWRWRSKRRVPGRPPIGWKLVRLIHRMSRDNPLWGPERIRNELLLLGNEVGVSTVARYMAQHRSPGRGQGWMTFLRNQMKVTAACDFFVVPSVTFRNLFVFVVLSHDRRLIRHVAVTKHPTAAWTARQILEAFPGGDEPELLLRDNDSIYGEEFSRVMKAAAIREVRTSYRSPWMNPYSERVNGTLRRELTDHVIAFNAVHLQRLLREYVERYYNPARPHMSLDGNAPLPRTREATPAEDVVATPVVGGLHHTYRRAA
jgi:transposase InsO family protein